MSPPTSQLADAITPTIKAHSPDQDPEDNEDNKTELIGEDHSSENDDPVSPITKVQIQNSVSPKHNPSHNFTGLHPLTESVHSFYKDTTFNSFRNITQKTGSFLGDYGANLAQATLGSIHATTMMGVQGIGLSHLAVR